MHQSVIDMKIDISDEVIKNYSEYLEKTYLSSDVSNNIENLITSELRRRSWSGYEFDPLTGCYTRFKFEKDLRAEISGSGWDDQTSYRNRFLCIDIDNFKACVDNIGMQKSDGILVDIAKELKTKYPSNKSYRFGGDEFVVSLGTSEICNIDVHPQISIKTAIVSITTEREWKRSYIINREILLSLEKGLQDSTLSGNEIEVEIRN